MKAQGIDFVREPRVESYGAVVVFKDLYGNLWDLVEFTAPVFVPASEVDSSQES